MLIGYARTSTLEQKASIEAQRESLKALGCERLYEEQISSVAMREALRGAMEYARQGDTLVVTKLDRLARSVRHLGEIVEALEAKGVGLKIVDLGLDTSNATGKLMLNVLGSVAQFEREMMLERQREGIAKAKALGKYKGRRPTAREKAPEIRQMVDEGRNPYGQFPSVNPFNGSSGMPCNGAACGAALGRPCVRSSIAQAADTRAASLVPFWAMSANASIATATCPSSNPDSAARIAAVSAFCDPAGRPAPGRMPPCFID